MREWIYMEIQNKFEFCNKTICNHKLIRLYSNCLVNLDVLFKREGGLGKNLNNYLCLDLDQVETNISKRDKRNKNSTVDCVFGISKNNQSKIVLCELKFNSKKPTNLKKTDLDAKLNYSKSIIGQQPSIYQKAIYLFKAKVKNQAKSHIRRLYSNRNICEVFDEQDFYNEFTIDCNISFPNNFNVQNKKIKKGKRI